MCKDVFQLAQLITRDHNRLMGYPTVEETLQGLTQTPQYSLEDVEFMRHMGITLEDASAGHDGTR